MRATARTIDQAAVEAWQDRLEPLIDTMAKAGDVPLDVQERYDAILA